MNAIYTHSAARPATQTGWARSRMLNGLGLAWLLAVFSSAPLSASAQTGFSVGYTAQHDGERGQTYMFDYVPNGGPWDVTVGTITGTQTRDTSFAVLSYEIVDQHLFASFGPGLVRHQTTTLTSQYQFMTTFGYHWSHASLGVRHLSNGGLRGKNIGESLVFVAITF